MKSRLHLIVTRFLAICMLLWLIVLNQQLTTGGILTDFVTSEYAAACFVRQGHAEELYPQLDWNTYVGAPFDHFVHRLFPSYPKERMGAYPNNPLVALYMVPLSFLPPQVASILWSLLSVMAIFVVSFCIARLSCRKASALFFSSTFYWPIFHILALGQLSLIFGLAPMALGTLLLYRKHPRWAGLVWCFALKPQYFVPAVFIALFLCALRRFEFFAFLLLGILCQTAIALVTVGPRTLILFVHNLKLMESMSIHSAVGIHPYLGSSLPQAIYTVLSPQWRDYAKPCVLAFSTLLICSGLLLAWRLRNTPSRLFWLRLCLIAVFLTVLTLPYLLFYDLSILWPALMLMSAKQWSAFEAHWLKKICVSVILIVDAEFLLIFFKPTLAQPLLEAVLLLIAYLAMCLVFLKSVRASSATGGETGVSRES